jgi:hypothetical protein
MTLVGFDIYEVEMNLLISGRLDILERIELLVGFRGRFLQKFLFIFLGWMYLFFDGYTIAGGVVSLPIIV